MMRAFYWPTRSLVMPTRTRAQRGFAFRFRMLELGWVTPVAESAGFAARFTQNRKETPVIA